MLSSRIDAVVKAKAGTLYEGGYFKVQIDIPDNYPFRAPDFTILTPIWHPNVKNGKSHGLNCGCNHQNFGPQYMLRHILLNFICELTEPEKFEKGFNYEVQT